MRFMFLEHSRLRLRTCAKKLDVEKQNNECCHWEEFKLFSGLSHSVWCCCSIFWLAKMKCSVFSFVPCLGGEIYSCIYEVCVGSTPPPPHHQYSGTESHSWAQYRYFVTRYHFYVTHVLHIYYRSNSLQSCWDRYVTVTGNHYILFEVNCNE